jgi:hypothetical protein
MSASWAKLTGHTKLLAYEGVDEQETIINADDDKSSIKGIKIMLMNKIFVWFYKVMMWRMEVAITS